MELQDLITRARVIREAYSVLNRTEGSRNWGANEYVQGLVGDVGDLAKIMMAKQGYRFADSDVDRELERELADCLWSIIAISDELDIDIENAFLRNLNQLEEKISDRKLLKRKRLDM